MKKTNAMRILDQHKVPYEAYEYDVADGHIDGIHVAKKVGLPMERVCKTLVSRAENRYYVFVIPVNMNLNLKLAASAAKEKKIEMLPQKNLKALTGYEHGGCSPIGMKKLFPTFIEESVQGHDAIAVSAGAIGFQVYLSPEDLANMTGGVFINIGEEIAYDS